MLGAGGVVGQAAVQLALLAGARRVIAVARSAPALEPGAEELGAAAAVPLRPDDDVPGLADRLRDAADGPVDLVLDPVFGSRPRPRCGCCGPAAGWSTWAARPAPTAPIDSATLRSGSLRMLGYTNNALSVAQRAEALGVVAGHAAAGRLTVDARDGPVRRGLRRLGPPVRRRRRRPDRTVIRRLIWGFPPRVSSDR